MYYLLETTFKLLDLKRSARKGDNFQTGEEIHIPASKVPVFKAGKAMEDAVKYMLQSYIPRDFRVTAEVSSLKLFTKK